MTTQNASLQKTFEAAGGPWSNISHAYCHQMDQAFKTAEPAVQAMGRVQAEWIQLATARARAWAALPGEFSRCRSPADLAMLQFNFWQAAGRTYAQGWQRILHASTALAQNAAQTSAEAPRRDVMAVPETPSDARSRQAA